MRLFTESPHPQFLQRSARIDYLRDPSPICSKMIKSFTLAIAYELKTWIIKKKGNMRCNCFYDLCVLASESSKNKIKQKTVFDANMQRIRHLLRTCKHFFSLPRPSVASAPGIVRGSSWLFMWITKEISYSDFSACYFIIHGSRLVIFKI